MARATWHGVVLADSDATVVIEGNHYFPPNSVRWHYLADSNRRSVCFWKGLARYYTVVVDGQANPNAAWSYPRPSPLARSIKDHVAFWGGVRIER